MRTMELSGGPELMETSAGLWGGRRPEWGFETTDRRRVDVTGLARNAVEVLNASRRPWGAGVQLTLPDEAVYAMANPRRLEQVLLLLLSSAAGALGRGAALESSIRLIVEPQDLLGEGPSTFHVQDMGVGLGDYELSNIFSPTGVVKGPRWSLTRARALVEAMGGQMMVKSRGPVGLTVTAELPGPGCSSW